VRPAIVTMFALHAAVAAAQSDRTATRERPELPSTVAPDVDAAFVGDGVGQRVRLLDERHAGVSAFVGTRYLLVGHEGRPELATSATVERHLGATLLRADAVFARELDRDQRDAVLALSALRAVARGLSLGVAGRAVVDLDDGRDDGGEIRWEARGGAAALLHLGARASLALHAGATSLAMPTEIRAGPFALAAVGGWF
jgi:hypothetical protein